MLYKGRISTANHGTNSYTVNFDDGRPEQPVTPLNMGVESPYFPGEEVICLKIPMSPWMVLGRVPVGQVVATEDQKFQQSETVKKAEAGGQVPVQAGRDLASGSYPDYKKPDDPVEEYGDSVLRSEASGGFVKVGQDGSIELVSGTPGLIKQPDETCSLSLMGFNQALRAMMSILELEVFPGLTLKVKPDVDKAGAVTQPSFSSGATPTERNKPKGRGTLVFESDPTNSKTELKAAIGALRTTDIAPGDSAKTQQKRPKSGISVTLGTDFASVEVDNDNKELRLSLNPKTGQTGLYQIRANQDEFTMTRGEQFISFTDDGLIIKADVIGLAGPVAMWSPTRTATFKQNLIPKLTDQDVAFEWKDIVSTGVPGINFKKSVYFGDEAAVTKPYLNEQYTQDITTLTQGFQAVMTHQHAVAQGLATPSQDLLGSIPGVLLNLITTSTLFSDPTGVAYLNFLSVVEPIGG